MRITARCLLGGLSLHGRSAADDACVVVVDAAWRIIMGWTTLGVILKQNVCSHPPFRQSGAAQLSMKSSARSMYGSQQQKCPDIITDHVPETHGVCVS